MISEPIKCLDHGYVRLVDSMGGDLSIVRAARVSYDAAWRAGEDQGSDARLIGYLWRKKILRRRLDGKYPQLQQNK